MELMGQSQSTFIDMMSELGLAESLGPKTEYTLLVPVNGAFTGELKHILLQFYFMDVIVCLLRIKKYSR